MDIKPGIQSTNSLALSNIRFILKIGLLAVTLPLLSCSDDITKPRKKSASPSVDLVFASARGDDGHNHLYILDADSIRALPKATWEIGVLSPAWSPDGEKIAYTAECSDKGPFELAYGPKQSTLDIYVVNADGSDLRPIVTSGAPDAGARWSPDGTMLAFVSLRSDPGEGVYVVNADGTGQRRVVEGGWIGEWPSWSPDSRKLVAPGFQLTIVDVVSGDSTSLGEGWEPMFTPDGKWIVCWARDRIEAVSLHGKPRKILSPFGARPVVSPSGELVAFSHVSSLWVVPFDGGDPVRVADHPECYVGDEYSWSPDSRYIAYWINDWISDPYGPDSDIYVADVLREKTYRITTDPAQDLYPAWRPQP